MVRNQILKRGVKNELVIKAMLEVPRHLFVDKGMQSQSYSDNALPLLRGQTISQPHMVALMSEMLKIEKQHKVLEIGTGCGYQAAVLAVLCDNVYSIERIPELAELAAENLKNAGYRVTQKTGDGTLGWPENAPFDRIIVTAGAPEMPPSLLDQLAEGGLMVAPVGSRSVQTLKLIQKVNGKPIVKNSYDCAFVPLIGESGWKE
ncbi:MAG: protein-L-isoaspartate(D-aspartate) O-methyltransferase [Fibrobacteres bacterium]|nr:protein-L-isoaspartate(D-aspartate) O-methyltransferase [Fibrobacterota bacterium]